MQGDRLTVGFSIEKNLAIVWLGFSKKTWTYMYYLSGSPFLKNPTNLVMSSFVSKPLLELDWQAY